MALWGGGAILGRVSSTSGQRNTLYCRMYRYGFMSNWYFWASPEKNTKFTHWKPYSTYVLSSTGPAILLRNIQFCYCQELHMPFCYWSINYVSHVYKTVIQMNCRLQIRTFTKIKFTTLRNKTKSPSDTEGTPLYRPFCYWLHFVHMWKTQHCSCYHMGWWNTK
jgi:hypothetical protein